MGNPLLIACDFDGTVTHHDTLVEILDRYGDPHWRRIQERVVSGEIPIREGLRLEMGSVQASPDQIKELLSAAIRVEPTFFPFFESARARGIPLVLLSGGFDLCVETVMRKSGLWPIPFLANRLIPPHPSPSPRRGEGRGEGWKVEFPYPSPSCETCGHCKADPIRTWNAQGYSTVFVGNGVTDRCPARVSTLTFAKDELADWCRRQGISAVRYETFEDVRKELERRGWL